MWLALPLLVSCSDDLPTTAGAPIAANFSAVTTAAIPAVRFSEIHYDNSGIDTGETIEISGPAGTDVTGWQVVLYNGNGGASYSTRVSARLLPGERLRITAPSALYSLQIPDACVDSIIRLPAQPLVRRLSRTPGNSSAARSTAASFQPKAS